MFYKRHLHKNLVKRIGVSLFKLGLGIALIPFAVNYLLLTVEKLIS